MKRVVVGVSVLALAISGYVALAQPADKPADGDRREPPRQPEGRPGEGRPGEGGPRRGPNANPQNLEGAMKLMGGNLKRLKGQITDSSKKDDNLKIVNEIQRGAIIAKGMDPTEAFKKESDPKKKAQMAIDFRKKMIELVGKLLTLESQIMDDKTADATKSIDELIKFRNENHEAFGVKD